MAMRRDIKNQYGMTIGFSKESPERIDYYLIVGGMIGFWDKRTKRYIALGKGGSGVKSQSDIGTGEVSRLAIKASKKEVVSEVDNDPDWVEVDEETADYLRRHKAGEFDNERKYTTREIAGMHGIDLDLD